MISLIVRHPRVVVILEVDCSAEDGPVPRDHFIQAVRLEGDMMQRGFDDRHCWPPKTFSIAHRNRNRGSPAHCWFACFAGQLVARRGSSVDGMSALGQERTFGKLLSYARRRACMEGVRAQLHVSVRRACAALGQHRSTQRKIPRGREGEERRTADIIELARQYGRYGYHKIAELLRQAGWTINDKRVERIWQREGLKVPHKQPKRGRLWLADGSCIRLRPEQRNHVWSYDFVEDRTHDGRRYRMLNVLDEFTHECLTIRVR